MDYQGYHDWYTLDVDPAKYYAEIAAVQDPDPQATASTRDTDETILPSARERLFNISAVPWTSFRSLHLELPEANDYLLPIFTLGRYREENGRTLLPLAMQVHHGVTDGFHVGRFFNRLQAWADSAPEMGA